MSAAAGAPPPPPPPPRCSGFDDLPAELLLILYRYLGLGQFMNLALALYPTLLRHRLVPELTPEVVKSITSTPRSTFNNAKSCSAMERMPMELHLQIAEYGEPADGIALLWALGIFHRAQISDEFLQILRIWSRRSEKNR